MKQMMHLLANIFLFWQFQTALLSFCQGQFYLNPPIIAVGIIIADISVIKGINKLK